MKVRQIRDVYRGCVYRMCIRHVYTEALAIGSVSVNSNEILLTQESASSMLFTLSSASSSRPTIGTGIAVAALVLLASLVERVARIILAL